MTNEGSRARSALVLVALSCTLALFACSKKESAPAAAPTPTETGVIEGTLRIEGTLPPPARLPTNASVARVCGDAVDDPSLPVGAEGRVHGAVVFVADAPAAAATGAGADAGTVVVDQKQCVFLPVTIAARAGAVLEMKNSDPLTHNVRAITPKGESLYNVAMPIAGMTLRRTLPPTPGELRLHCDIHPWMNAHVRTFDHPHFATTDATGRFRLQQIPAGKRRVELWHPRLPSRSIEVEVKPGQTSSVEFVLQASDVRPLE